MIENPYAILERRINRLETLLVGIDEKVTPKKEAADVQLTKKGLAKKWDVSVRTIDNYIADGMPVLQHKRGGLLLISFNEATEFLKEPRNNKKRKRR